MFTKYIDVASDKDIFFRTEEFYQALSVLFRVRSS